jgi:hypothetical protein
MDKTLFLELLKRYELIYDYVDKYSDFGIDLTEDKYPILSEIDTIFDLIFGNTYNSDGVDWIYWFAFENKFGKKKLEAYDNGKLICQTAEELYDYIEQYRIQE